MRSTFILFLAMFFCVAVNAQEIKIDNARNSCNDYLKLKKEIDDVTTKIMDERARDNAFISKFRKAQFAWETSRDAQLEMIFSADNKGIYGASYPICRCNALIELTNERLDYLVRWVSNVSLSPTYDGSANAPKRKSFAKLSE